MGEVGEYGLVGLVLFLVFKELIPALLRLKGSGPEKPPHHHGPSGPNGNGNGKCDAPRHDGNMARLVEIGERQIDILDKIVDKQNEQIIASERLHTATRDAIRDEVGKTRHALKQDLQAILASTEITRQHIERMKKSA